MENICPDENTVLMKNRHEINVSGAVSLGSYDEKAIVMETGVGSLEVHGADLNVRHMDLENGSIIIEGRIQSLVYGSSDRQKKNFLKRFIR